MIFDALGIILAIPLAAAALFAILPGYRLTANLNVAAALLTLLAAVSLFVVEPTSGNYLLVDDLNKVFVAVCDRSGSERGLEFEDYETPRTVEGVAQLGPNRGAWFKDPDGNIFALVELQAA